MACFRSTMKLLLKLRNTSLPPYNSINKIEHLNSSILDKIIVRIPVLNSQFNIISIKTIDVNLYCIFVELRKAYNV